MYLTLKYVSHNCVGSSVMKIQSILDEPQYPVAKLNKKIQNLLLSIWQYQHLFS